MDLLLLLLVGLGVGIFQILKIVYRLYLHPLRHIPGPKLAAITHFYDFYYNIYHKGTFIFQIEELHKVYGTSLGRKRTSDHNRLTP